MAYSTISSLLAATSLSGTELLEVSQLSSAVTISAATISALASDNSFNDSGSGFVTAGFAAGDRVKVTGFTGNVANNIFVAEITTLTAGKMTIGGADGDVIVDDAAGETVTISKWVTRRTTSQEIADLTKSYVDTQLAKVASRKVRVASTAAVTLATGVENGDTIDGVTLATGDRVLLKNQSSGSENGIWVVAASGAPTRATDADSSDELVNISVWVSEGTTNADTLWTCTTNAPITVNTTALTFTSISVGGVTYASTTEQLTGTETSKASNPDSIAALWEQGSDVASAGTVSLGEGGYFVITGTTTITDIDFATDKAGRKAWVKFAGALTLTHNASTLILPGGASITTAAGDTACFVSEGSDVVRCVAYQRASGQAISSASAAVSSQSGTSYTAVLADANTFVRFTNASAISFTIPPNSSVAFPVGTVIEVEQAGAGALSFVAGSGVTLNSRSSDLTLAGQYAVAFAKKVATDTWTVNGDL